MFHVPVSSLRHGCGERLWGALCVPVSELIQAWLRGTLCVLVSWGVAGGERCVVPVIVGAWLWEMAVRIVVHSATD